MSRIHLKVNTPATWKPSVCRSNHGLSGSAFGPPIQASMPPVSATEKFDTEITPEVKKYDAEGDKVLEWEESAAGRANKRSHKLPFIVWGIGTVTLMSEG